MKRLIASAILALPLAIASLQTQASAAMVILKTPASAPYVVARQVWIPGHWNYTPHGRYWVQGHYARA